MPETTVERCYTCGLAIEPHQMRCNGTPRHFTCCATCSPPRSEAPSVPVWTRDDPPEPCDCGDCGECNGAEDSDDSDPVPYRNGVGGNRKRFRKASREALLRGASPRFVAAEVEVARADSYEAIEYAAARYGCAIVHDGSLPTGGYEVNTCPAAGDAWIDLVQGLGKAMARDGAKATASCGLHVHVDCQDFTWHDMRRLMYLYVALEPALFQTIPASRRTSHYCVPCGDRLYRWLEDGGPTLFKAKDMRHDTKRKVWGAIYDGNFSLSASGVRAAKDSRYVDVRYAALNLHSWVYRGTVECRMHPGTTQAEKIIQWGRAWVQIVDSAMRGKESTFRDAAREVEEAYARETFKQAEYGSVRAARYRNNAASLPDTLRASFRTLESVTRGKPRAYLLSRAEMLGYCASATVPVVETESEVS